MATQPSPSYFRISEATSYLPVAAVVLFAVTVLCYYPLFHLGKDSSVTAPELQYAVSVTVLSAAEWWNVLLAACIIGYSVDTYDLPTQWKRAGIFGVALLLGTAIGSTLPLVAGKPQAILTKAIFAATKIDVDPILNTNNALCGLAAAAILFSLWTLTNGHNMSDARRGARSAEFFTLSLYSAAALLAAGIFEIFAVFHWGWVMGSCDADKHCAVAPEDFAANAGILLSILLIVMYVPAAIVMDMRMRALFETTPKAVQAKGFSAWTDRVGLPTSPLKALSSYGAVLLPFVTGILTRFLHTSG